MPPKRGTESAPGSSLPEKAAAEGPPEDQAEPSEEAARASRRTRLLRVLGLVVLLALIVWGNLYASENRIVRDLLTGIGYPGVLLAAAVSGFNIVVPVPVIAYFPLLVDLGYDPELTVVVIALGMTLGDLVGYVLGRIGRSALPPGEGSMLRRIERLRERHPRLPFFFLLFYAAFVPAPNELVVIPLAFAGYRVGGIFLGVLVGNLVFNALVASGLVGIFDLLS